MNNYSESNNLHRSNSYWSTIILCSCILYISIVNMLVFMDSSLNFSLIPYAQISIGIMILLIINSVVILFKKKISIFILFIFSFGVVTIFSTVLNFSMHENNILNSLVYQFMWVSTFILFYFEAKKTTIERVNRYLMVNFLVIGTLFFYLYSLLEKNSGFNLVYYVLVFLPFILILKKKSIQFVLILLVTFIVLLSLKRLALIILIVSLATYFLMNYLLSNKRKGKLFYSLMTGFLLTISIFSIYQFTSENLSLDINQRFLNIVDDGGSGRDSIYQNVWEDQLNSSIGDWLIGNGYNGVALNSTNGSAAHNDFLEVIYNYGIFGFLIYLAIWVILIYVNVILIKRKSALAAPFSVSLVIFVFLSTFSILIIYPRYFLYLVIFWAISISKKNDYKNHNNYN